jgi:Protein of unknown function (DUF3102)
MDTRNLPEPADPHKATIEGSNSLADLAALIQHEHQAVSHALKRGLEHAIAAGKLLIEAKERLRHGQWLSWLKEHCQIPERSAQRYMALARYAPAKSGNVADLTLELPPPSAEPDCDDLWELAQRRLDAPFSEADFPSEDEGFHDFHGWVRTKLMHQADMPAIAAWCFDVAEVTEDSRPALRLCPWDDLWEAVKVLAPIVSDKAERQHTLKFDFGNMRSMHGAIAVVTCDAMWLLGNVLNEIDARKYISDEDYEREWQETHAQVMARLEEKRAALPEAAE